MSDRELKPLTIPMEEADNIKYLPLHTMVIEMGDGIGRVCSTAGMGSDLLIMEWKGKRAYVRHSELLKAWVETFAPEDAKLFPERVRSLEKE